MGERKLPGVKHLPVDPVPPLGERVFRHVPVRLVSEYRSSHGCQVDAYLVRPARFDAAGEERVFSGDFRLERFVVGDGRLSGFVHPYLRLVLGILHAEKFFPYGTSGILWGPRGDRGVGLVHLVVLERRKERVKRPFLLGDQYDAGGVPVDAVDERRTERERVELAGIVVRNGFDERIFVALMVSRMHVQSGRFVDGENEVVFEEDAVFGEDEFRRPRLFGRLSFRRGLPPEFREFLFAQKEFDGLPEFETVVVFAFLSVDFRAVGAAEFVD